ncbi:IPT/TIG domain-containing protein [Kitasatospora sp. NPDC089509]|uniref:lipase family protein n=1 Tax=Kitasatospora sp. NPDC089509 TaxID=3364079 RepID=UPI0038297FA2
MRRELAGDGHLGEQQGGIDDLGAVAAQDGGQDGAGGDVDGGRQLLLYQRWVADRLAVVRNCEHRQLRQLLQRFDTWHVSRRLRTKAAREPLGQSRVGYARNRISQAASLGERLCRRGLGLRRQPCALWHDVPPPGTFPDVPGGIQRERTRRSGGAVRSQGVRMTTEQSTPTTAQVAMTLAAIAATAATPRPSGETLAEQQKRMFLGVGQQLANPSLATGTDWNLLWLALSPGNANMAYLAANRSANAFAVVLRGTVAEVTDLLEDLDVGTVVPFTAVGTPSAPVFVSKGAMEAFSQVVTMSTAGITLVQALAAALADASPNPTVHVIGHSLGGCIATMVAPYLQTQAWPQSTVQFGLHTFAAPTAGGTDFAAYVDSLNWVANVRHFNTWDLVPQAWTSLDNAKKWYPAPGPAANDQVNAVITALAALPGPHGYAQPGNADQLHPDYQSDYDHVLIKSTVQDFMGQVAYQHANSTYLGLLGAADVPSGPVVRGIVGDVGNAGSVVVIAGSGFDPGATVDFGTVPCQNPVISSDGNSVTVRAPAGVGVVAVRVTTTLGTSPAVPFGQFAYDGPAPVTLTGLTPPSGAKGDPIVITGIDFDSDAQVYFGDNPSPSVQINLTGEPSALVAIVPDPSTGVGKPATVDVTVLSNGYSSPPGPAAEFTYEKS